MNVLICTSSNILLPSAGKNRLTRMRRALAPHGIKTILVGAGNSDQPEPWCLIETPGGLCITFNPNRVQVWRHCRALKIGAQAVKFYQDYLVKLIERFECSGIIDYSFQGQVSRAILEGVRMTNSFVVADVVEHFNLSWHYLFNGINYQQLQRCRVLLPKMNGVIGISKAWCAWADKQGIPNVWIPPFAEDYCSVRTKPSLPDRPFTMVFLGHWVPRELPRVFLKALQLCIEQNIDVRMIVLGNVGKSSRERPAMRFLQKDPVLAKHVTFRGFVSDQERDHELAESDAFIILRSDNRETEMLFPTRLPEYMLSGNPVVLSKVGSFPQCFEHKKDVWFVSARNTPEEVAEAILYLAQHPTERLEIGRQGRKTALAQFSLEALGSRLARFLEQCAAQNYLRR